MDIDKTGVIVVDVQGDFTVLKSGSLPVKGTDQSYVDKVMAATHDLSKKGYKIFATQDYHPENHISFYTSHENMAPYDIIDMEGRFQILWPPHCVIGTDNARLLIDTGIFTAIIKKGMDAQYDSYSGFFDDGGMNTGLDECLRSHGIDTVIVYGLAMDYCVKATVMDAIKSGFKVIVAVDLSKGVAEDTTRSALREMTCAGAQIIRDIQKILS